MCFNMTAVVGIERDLDVTSWRILRMVGDEGGDVREVGDHARVDLEDVGVCIKIPDRIAAGVDFVCRNVPVEQEGVRSVATPQVVIAALTPDTVIAATAVDPIVARATCEEIFTGIADDPVATR